MIAVDTNILIYAHREESPWNAEAQACLVELASSGRTWAIPWPCLHEFVAIATHPRVFKPPSRLQDAVHAVERWLACPTLVVLAEEPGYWPLLRRQIESSRVAGPRVHDGRIAALCLLHGVSELLTADRDFSSFTSLTTRNPLPGQPRKRT